MHCEAPWTRTLLMCLILKRSKLQKAFKHLLEDSMYIPIVESMSFQVKQTKEWIFWEIIFEYFLLFPLHWPVNYRLCVFFVMILQNLH